MPRCKEHSFTLHSTKRWLCQPARPHYADKLMHIAPDTNHSNERAASRTLMDSFNNSLSTYSYFVRAKA